MLTAEEVARMTREEKWDALSLLQSSLENDNPPWMESVLLERREKIESGDAVFHPWDEVEARLKRLSQEPT